MKRTSEGDRRRAPRSSPDMTPPEDDEVIAADLVGWATRTPVPTDQPLPPERTRDLLGTALGVEPSALGALDTDQLDTALARVRGLVEQCRRLAAEVGIDDLTGALRRGVGMAALNREIARARRTGEGLLCLFLDVDGLKRVNDSRGHAAGDRVLTDVVTAVRHRLRAYDLVIRYGGDEFVCVLSKVPEADAEARVEAIRESVRTQTEAASISVGAAQLQPDDTAAALIGRADSDLYERRRARRVSPTSDA